ncbi:MAG: MlaD family protein [bacterium]
MRRESAIVLTLLIIGAASFTAFVFVTGEFRFLEPGYNIKVAFDDINNLRERARVYYIGIEVGQVDKIERVYDPDIGDLRYEVTLFVRDGVRIHRADIFNIGIVGIAVGARFINITSGGDYNSPFIEPGEMVWGVSPSNLPGDPQELKGIGPQARTYLTAAASFNAAQGYIALAEEYIRENAPKWGETLRAIDRTLKGFTFALDFPTMAERLSTFDGEMRRIREGIAPAQGAIVQAAETTGNMRKSMDEVERVIEGLIDATSGAREQTSEIKGGKLDAKLDEIMENLKDISGTLDEIESVLRDVKEGRGKLVGLFSDSGKVKLKRFEPAMDKKLQARMRELREWSDMVAKDPKNLFASPSIPLSPEKKSVKAIGTSKRF